MEWHKAAAAAATEKAREAQDRLPSALTHYQVCRYAHTSCCKHVGCFTGSCSGVCRRTVTHRCSVAAAEEHAQQLQQRLAASEAQAAEARAAAEAAAEAAADAAAPAPGITEAERTAEAALAEVLA